MTRSLIASECSHSCSKTAQHLRHCATRLGTECIGKLQTHAQSRIRICRYNFNLFETNPKHTHEKKTTKQTSQRTHTIPRKNNETKSQGKSNIEWKTCTTCLLVAPRVTKQPHRNFWNQRQEMSESAREQLNTKISNNNTTSTTLVVQPCGIFTAVGQLSFHPKPCMRI